jgi:signal transduction histidine kinase
MFHYSNSFISAKHEHRLLGVMLITLHLALWWDFLGFPFPELLKRVVLLIHFGFFMLWQPLLSRLSAHPVRNWIIVGLMFLIFIIFANIWLMTLWQILLLGILGGRDLVKPVDRMVNVAAIVFGGLELLIFNIFQLFAIPELAFFFSGTLEPMWWFFYGLLSVPLAFLLISTDDDSHRYYVDFFHGLIVSLLIVIMILGSLVIHLSGDEIMPSVIFQMCLAILVFLLTASWLWVVLADDEGVVPLWTKHLHTIGSAFEQGLDELAQPSQYKNLTPQEFLRTGFEQLMTLPWINGIAWHSLYGEDMLGEADHHVVNIAVQSIEVTVYAHYRISGSYYFQIKILIQLLEHFHQAKRREAAFAQQAHLQAIHETGAKLTHDIKNLLQSLHAITSVIETYPQTKFGDTQRLLQGQMPHLTQRLKRTLDKLQKPAEFSYSHVPVNLWWDNLKARYRKSQIEFARQVETENVLIPEDLFDNVSENLLQNALMKRQREPKLHITVFLHISKRRLQLTVCDDGTPIPNEIFNNLFNQPVPSRDGFGIGLYHVVKHLAHTGYQLNVTENKDGQVCFELVSTD